MLGFAPGVEHLQQKPKAAERGGRVAQDDLSLVVQGILRRVGREDAVKDKAYDAPELRADDGDEESQESNQESPIRLGEGQGAAENLAV